MVYSRISKRLRHHLRWCSNRPSHPRKCKCHGNNRKALHICPSRRNRRSNYSRAWHLVTTAVGEIPSRFHDLFPLFQLSGSHNAIITRTVLSVHLQFALWSRPGCERFLSIHNINVATRIIKTDDVWQVTRCDIEGKVQYKLGWVYYDIFFLLVRKDGLFLFFE